jgi:hypothetical protein
MRLRTVNIRLEPVASAPGRTPHPQLAGHYTVEVDAALSPAEIRAAAIEALVEAIEIDDLSQFTVEVS